MMHTTLSESKPLLRFFIPPTLSTILRKRTFIGFKISEALVKLAFCFLWPVLLGSLYYFSGVFENDARGIQRFIYLNLYFVLLHNLLIMPIWWVFFIKLKHVSLFKRFLLHVPMAFLFALSVTACMENIRAGFSGEILSRQGFVSEVYKSAIYYFFDFAVFHAYNLWLSSLRQRKKEQELRELAFQSEINALKAQIEPHFLFNTLNSISASVPPSLEKTRVLIAQLADTFRYALRVSESRLVPLSDEIDFIKTFLALEKHRFGNRLQISYDIDCEVMVTKVPPMILQPIVENSLNHGISPHINGGTVTIQCKKKDNFVYIAVSDTGVGYAGDLDQILNKSVGLGNISRRLSLLYNESIVVSRNQQGLTFSFHVPLEIVHETKRTYYR
ncbi:MAG TPA: histidine kinase [Flavisolibacter sp.]|jgi:signal transduction histidine kinase|nr:histidine kinase [Flavisolibacter sp.]